VRVIPRGELARGQDCRMICASAGERQTWGLGDWGTGEGAEAGLEVKGYGTRLTLKVPHLVFDVDTVLDSHMEHRYT
jgi:hypothetical protein